jgi:hypothetical protein
MLVSIYGQAFFFLPSLHGSHITPEEAGDFFPGIKPVCGIFLSHREDWPFRAIHHTARAAILGFNTGSISLPSRRWNQENEFSFRISPPFSYIEYDVTFRFR